MKQLENRTLDSKIELEIMDALDEIKAVNRRHETVDTAEVLKRSAARRENGTADPVSYAVVWRKPRTYFECGNCVLPILHCRRMSAVLSITCFPYFHKVNGRGGVLPPSR